MNNFNEPELTFVCGDLDENVKGKYSVVVANIVADVIMMFAPNVRKYMAPDGTFIASGIIDTRADEVIACLENNGFTIVERYEQNGWNCLVMK